MALWSFSDTAQHYKELRHQMRNKHGRAQLNTLFVIPFLAFIINCPNVSMALSSLYLKYNLQSTQKRRYPCHKKHRQISIYHESLSIQASCWTLQAGKSRKAKSCLTSVSAWITTLLHGKTLHNVPPCFSKWELAPWYCSGGITRLCVRQQARHQEWHRQQQARRKAPRCGWFSL